MPHKKIYIINVETLPSNIHIIDYMEGLGSEHISVSSRAAAQMEAFNEFSREMQDQFPILQPTAMKYEPHSTLFYLDVKYPPSVGNKFHGIHFGKITPMKINF